MTAPTTEHTWPAEQPRAPRLTGLVPDVAIILGSFLVAGAVGAVVWRLLVHLPQASKVQGQVGLTADQMTGQVSLDGWYFVIAAVGGLLVGAALTWWRRRDPLITVALVVLGAGISAYLMVRLGHVLGPPDPDTVLRTKSDGAQAPVSLRLAAPGVAWVWPLAAALGALAVLWGTPNPDEPRS